jgi:hypothetical protein
LAKSLDAILAELDASYAPQRQSIQTRMDALPAQADAEIEGLKATQQQAFQDILGGARDRGMGFSGVPIAEQSRYTASSFLPAVARVRQSQNESKQSLFDALNNINLQKQQFGQGIYQQELDRDEQSRQFNESLAAQQRAAAAAQTNPYAGLFDNAGANQGSQPAADPLKQRAQADVANLLTKDKSRIQGELNAIAKSAGFGNSYDKLKLQLLAAYGYKPGTNKPIVLKGSLGGSSARIQG